MIKFFCEIIIRRVMFGTIISVLVYTLVRNCSLCSTDMTSSKRLWSNEQTTSQTDLSWFLTRSVFSFFFFVFQTGQTRKVQKYFDIYIIILKVVIDGNGNGYKHFTIYKMLP